MPFTAASTWTWIDHRFQVCSSDSPPYSDLVSFGSGAFQPLTSAQLTRTVLQKSTRSLFLEVPQLVNTGFRFSFTPLRDPFTAKPSQYYALSFTKEYLALRVVPAPSHKVPRVSRGTLDPAALLDFFMYRAFLPSLAGFPKPFHYSQESLVQSNPSVLAHWFETLPFPKLCYFGNRCFFLLLRLLDVSVHRVPLHTLWIGVWIRQRSSHVGFPIQKSPGSLDICSSPKLFAAYHVFHRLLVPKASTLRSFPARQFYLSVLQRRDNKKELLLLRYVFSLKAFLSTPGVTCAGR